MSHQPTPDHLHELLAATAFVTLLIASTALSLLGRTLPSDLSAILHLAAGWLFGATTTHALITTRNGGPK